MDSKLPTHARQLTHQIDDLVKHEGGICLSLYLPIAKTPPESDKNPVRLKEQLNALKERLKNDGLSDNALDDFVKPIEQYVHTPRELLVEGESLAFFRSNDRFEIIELPYRIEPQGSISNRFLIRPLLNLRNENCDAIFVCLNRGDVRAFTSDRLHTEPLSIEGLPSSIDEVTGVDDPEKSVQHHTAKTVSDKGDAGTGIASQTHGQGLPEDLRDEQRDRFFREVAKAIDHHLGGQSTEPLVFIGVEENLGRIRQVHDWSNFKVLTVSEDPSAWKLSTIRAHAWELIESELAEARAAAKNAFEEADGKDTLLRGVDEVAIAAATSRVERAAISSGAPVPGVVDVDNMEVKRVVEGDPACAHDLLDQIAAETIRHGGEVAVMDSEDIPGEHEAVALPRF